MRKRNAETDLTSSVIEALNLLPGVMAWRSPAGKVKSRGGGWVQLAPAGTADIVGLMDPHGVFLGVETKSNHRDACRCESCEKQRAWGEAVVARGGVYLKTRTLEAVIAAVAGRKAA